MQALSTSRQPNSRNKRRRPSGWARLAKSLARSWSSPQARDRVAAVSAATVGISGALLLQAYGALDRYGWINAGSWFLMSHLALASVTAPAAWYAWRRARSTRRELSSFQRDEEERRTIAAIGVGSTWDLELNRVHTRFANDLKQLVSYDRLALTAARPDGHMVVSFVSGEKAELSPSGTVVIPGAAEPDGLSAPKEQGFPSQLTVPVLAINGTLTLRSKTPDAYGPKHTTLLRQVVAQVAPGMANALIYESSRRQLQERTALAEIGRAATGEHELPQIFNIVRDALSRLVRFDHMGVVLVSEQGKGRLAYCQPLCSEEFTEGAEFTLPPETGTAQTVVHRDNPFVEGDNKDLAHGSPAAGHAWLLTPLQVRDRTLGMLLLEAPSDEWARQEQRQLLQQVALQVAPAVENAQLLVAERALKQKLDQQHKGLQAAQQAKDQFLFAVSHELRTPLAIISGFIDLLSKDPTRNLNSEQIETMKVMRRNVMRLAQMIGDLLDISRIGAKSFRVNKRVFYGLEMIDAIVKDIQPFLDEKRQTLVKSIQVGPVWLEADRDRLEQLIANLLTNATKYSPAGSDIRLKTAWDGSDFKASVMDKGIGISAEQQKRLFEPFYRVDNETTRAVQGSGLGLYISKTIVDMHGGRIWLESAPGKGTTFHVSLPCVVAEPKKEATDGVQSGGSPRSRLYPDLDLDDIPANAA